MAKVSVTGVKSLFQTGDRPTQENYVDLIGIDVSKLTIDAYIHKKEIHRLFTNNRKGFKELLIWVNKHLGSILYFYCFENTGNYSLKLASYLSLKGIAYVEESPIKIKRSSGLVREKTDKIDSEIIARYAWVYREELLSSEVKSVVYQELGRLIGLRDQLVRSRSGLFGTLKEIEQLLSSPSTDTSCIVLRRSIENLSKQIKSIESRMDSLLKEE